MEGGITLETLQVIINAETKPIRDELNKLQSEVKKTTKETEKQTNKISSFFKKIGKTVAIALSVTALVFFGKSCIQLGSDLQEVQNVVDVTFGEMSDNVNNFAKNAISQFGLSELSAKQYSSTMGAMLKSMGLTSDEVLIMSKNLTGLSGDIASFYNLSGDEAFAKLRAGISGETEPLKQLGINMSVANLEAYALSQGITKSYNEMEQAEQALLRYNYLMEVTADAQGDFARTSDSWANQTKILAENFNSVKASIGQGLINVFTPVLRLLNEIIPRLQAVADMFRNLTAAIFGDAGGGGDAVRDAAVSAGTLNDNMQGVAASAESTKRALSGIDKLNNISSSDSDKSSTGSASFGIDTSGIGQVSDAVEKEISKVKTSFNSLSTWIKSNFSGVCTKVYGAGKTNFDKLVSAGKKTWETLNRLKSPLKEWFDVDVSAFANSLITALTNTLAGVTVLFTTAFTDIWTLAVLPMFENFIVIGLPMLTQFATMFTDTLGILGESILEIANVLWSEGISPLFSLLSTTWENVLTVMNDTWQTYGVSIFEGVQSAIQSVTDLFLNAWNEWIKPVWDDFISLLEEVWSEHMQPFMSKVGDFVGRFVTAALDIYNEFIAPVVRFFSEILGPVIKSVFNGIFSVVGPIIGNIIDAMGEVMNICGGVCDFIAGVFTLDWNRAWTGIKDIFGGIWTGMVAVVKAPVNLIIGLINGLLGAVEGFLNLLIDGINVLSFDVPDWVPVIGGEHFGFDLKSVDFGRIKYLAKGGIVNSATPAIIGEAGKEAVLPLENNTGWMDILCRRLSAYNNNSTLSDAIYYLADKIGDGNIYVRVDMDGDVIYEKLELRKQQSQKMAAGYVF